MTRRCWCWSVVIQLSPLVCGGLSENTSVKWRARCALPLRDARRGHRGDKSVSGAGIAAIAMVTHRHSQSIGFQRRHGSPRGSRGPRRTGSLPAPECRLPHECRLSQECRPKTRWQKYLHLAHKLTQHEVRRLGERFIWLTDITSRGTTATGCGGDDCSWRYAGLSDATFQTVDLRRRAICRDRRDRCCRNGAGFCVLV
jgi:hypothetical protein